MASKEPLEVALHETEESENLEEGIARQYLCVQLKEDLYAFSIDQVIEVTKPETPTPVPKLPDYVTGVVRRGRGIVAVLDLRRLCGKDSELNPARMIVLKRDELEAAVPVTQVAGIFSVLSKEISENLSGLGAIEAFASGQFERSDSVYSVVDVQRLLQHASPALRAS